MNIESLLPLYILLAVFLLAFAAEAAVMTLFKLKKFWPAFVLSLFLNVVSFSLIYFLARPFLSSLGYDIGKFNGLNLQAQVIAFLWWFCVMVEGSLLTLFLRRSANSRVFVVAALMNLGSFIFLYVFDIVSH